MLNSGCWARPSGYRIGNEEHEDMGIGTFVALIPPILAIVLCLLSKEVNLSLAAGVVVGALLYSQHGPEG